jgi:hypothetical protein
VLLDRSDAFMLEVEKLSFCTLLGYDDKWLGAVTATDSPMLYDGIDICAEEGIATDPCNDVLLADTPASILGTPKSTDESKSIAPN